MSRLTPDQLRGEVLAEFELWRSLGMSEAAALAEVEALGEVPEAAGQSDGVPDRFTERVGLFEGLGMDPDAARRAAIGRAGSEYAARQELAEIAPVAATPRSPEGATLREALASFTRAAEGAGMSDERAVAHVRNLLATTLFAEAARLWRGGRV